MTGQPNVAAGMIHIHTCITRAINVTIENAQAFASQGFASPALRAGYTDYVRSLLATLDGHHLSEDDIAFPYFTKVMPDAPYNELLAEHRQIVGILELLKPHIEELSSAADPTHALQHMSAVVRQLRAVWRCHMVKEEDNFTVARMAELIPLPEHIRLLGILAAHTQKVSGPDYLTVPFLLHNLAPEDRAAVAAGMPAVVTQELVPIVWKEKWAPMLPFLLP